MGTRPESAGMGGREGWGEGVDERIEGRAREAGGCESR